jgi:hypothetical protein
LCLLRAAPEQAPELRMMREEDLVKAFREERLPLHDGIETAAK